MQRHLLSALTSALLLLACAKGTGTGEDQDDSGVGGDTVTTGVGGNPTTTSGVHTTAGVGGQPTTTGAGGAPTTSSAGSGGFTTSATTSVTSSTSSGSGGSCTTSQILMDTSFEGGTPNTAWTESSTNFGTPLCTSADCGTAGSSNPVHSGTWFAWFGGYAGGLEQSSVQQSITIPANAQSATLTYWLEAPICDVLIDFVVNLDGTQLQYWTEPAGPSPYAGCGVTPGWAQQTIDVSSFADGVAKTLSIEVTQDGTGSTSGSNFLVDDVELTICN